MTPSDKLETVEFLVQRYYPSSQSGNAVGQQIYETLKSIAVDYRARDRIKIGATIHKFERAIDRAEAKKQPHPYGYQAGNLREIAELVIGSWPVIRQALEQFDVKD